MIGALVPAMSITATTSALRQAAGSPDRPAAAAAARVGRAGALLSGLGLACSLFVVVRLLETWRITPGHASRAVSLLGQRLSLPTANAAAVVVLVLASLGLAATATAVLGLIAELAASRRLQRQLHAARPQPLGSAFVIVDDRPRAFCAGLLRPRVYVTSGAVALLDERALEAVLAHERHHAGRRDPLRLAAARVLARALFFIPALGELSRRHQALAELSADESAVNCAPGNRAALARAMLRFSDEADADNSVGIDPTRVDFLLGEAPSWRFPTLICLAAVALLSLLSAVAVLAGHVASGSATLALPFLSAQPCILVLAALPTLISAVAFRLRRRSRS